MTRRDADCRRFAPGLSALAAGREPLLDRDAVVDHLARCEGCLDALQGLTLTAHALRRLSRFVDGAEPDEATWHRLRDRIIRSRANAAALAWRWQTKLAGSITGALVVAALVAPLALRLPLGPSAGQLAGDGQSQRGLFGLRTDDDNDPALRSGVNTPSDTSGPTNGLPLRPPDGIAPVAKEVRARVNGRPLTAD